jgi:hypothetical protein
MNELYVVVDPEGNVSFSASDDQPENFTAFAAANKRAEEMAENAPGHEIGIYKLVAFAVAETKPVSTVLILPTGEKAE